MDKRVQGLVALAAVVVIVAGGYHGFTAWRDHQDQVLLDETLKRASLKRDIESAEADLARWDAGDTQWAYDLHGEEAEKMIETKRFILKFNKDELAKLGP